MRPIGHFYRKLEGLSRHTKGMVVAMHFWKLRGGSCPLLRQVQFKPTCIDHYGCRSCLWATLSSVELRPRYLPLSLYIFEVSMSNLSFYLTCPSGEMRNTSQTTLHNTMFPLFRCQCLQNEMLIDRRTMISL